MSTIKTIIDERGVISYSTEDNSLPILKINGVVSASQFMGDVNLSGSSLTVNQLNASLITATTITTSFFSTPNLTLNSITASYGLIYNSLSASNITASFLKVLTQLSASSYIGGDIVHGTSASTNTSLAIFSDATGKNITDSSITISASNLLQLPLGNDGYQNQFVRVVAPKCSNYIFARIII